MAMKMKYRSKSSMLDAIKQLTANIPEETLKRTRNFHAGKK